MEASAVLDGQRAEQDAAFERFYRRYAQHVYRYTLAVLRNPADAEDVTQTTFLNAYRAMQQGQRPEKPHNWLIKIAHNACRSRYLARRRRVAEVPLDDAINDIVVAPEERPNVRAVLRALGRLPFNQRSALVMRELEGRSYNEIADTLGVSVPAVEMLIFRARKAMRVQARSLRALGAVQLPASLASWFESGAVLATGGAAVGTGIVVKAAIALVALTATAGAVEATGGIGKPDLPFRTPAARERPAPVPARATPVIERKEGSRSVEVATPRGKPAAQRASRGADAGLDAEAVNPAEGHMVARGDATPVSSQAAPEREQSEPTTTVARAAPIPAPVNAPTPVQTPPVPVPTPQLPPVPVETPTTPTLPKLP